MYKALPMLPPVIPIQLTPAMLGPAKVSQIPGPKNAVKPVASIAAFPAVPGPS